MKKIIISSILIPIAFSLASGQTNYNKVYWVHGFGDDQYTWNTYKNALIPSKNQGTSIDWSSYSSLSVASNSLNTKINNEVSSSKKAIVFGHSAGGLVARNAAKSNSKIRAVITAGTPNQGAGIVTTLKNKSLNNVAKKAISKVQANLIFGSQAVGSLLPGVGNALASLISTSFGLAGEVGKALADDAIEDLKADYSTRAADDMNPDLSQNAFLKNLNSSASSKPIINIYGNEDDNRLVRIAGTALHKAENDTNTTDNCYDETAFQYYNTALNTSTTFEVLHYAAGTTTAVLGIYCPYYFAASALNFTAAASWTDTRRFIQYDVHNEWDSMIGAVHTDRIEKWHKILWVKWCDVSYVTVYEDSDGFIPNNSSKMTGSNVTNIEVKGVNHLEMNSHPDMRARLRQILNTTTYGTDFNYNY